MFRCNNCDEMFEEPERKNIIAEEHLGISNLFPTRTRMDTFICPGCGDDDIEELMQCELCKEWVKEEDIYDTEGMVNGSVGYACSQCIEDNDIH